MTNTDKSLRWHQTKMLPVHMLLLAPARTSALTTEQREGLRFVLGLVNSMASELADFHGSTVPDVWNRHAEVVERETADDTP